MMSHQDAYRLGYNGRLLLERPKHRYIKVLLRACKTYPFLSDDFIKRRGLPLALPFFSSFMYRFLESTLYLMINDNHYGQANHIIRYSEIEREENWTCCFIYQQNALMRRLRDFRWQIALTELRSFINAVTLCTYF